MQASQQAFAAILADGRIVTWGESGFGGDSSPVQEELKNVQDIQAPLCRIAPSVRVDSDRLGSTWCGIVSIFATVGRLGPVTPSPLGLVGPLARQIRLSWIISLRCRKPCGVFATGRSVDAQLRTLRADSNSRATAPTTPYIYIQASQYAFAAILGDGAVVTWGDPRFGGNSSEVKCQLKNVQRISASYYAFAAILADGSVVTWGDAQCGGDSRRVQQQLKNVQQIHSTQYAFAAILMDGHVVTWGQPDAGGSSHRVQGMLKKVQGGVAQKGQLAKHQWVRPVLRGAGDPLAGESLRRARRRLARLHELRQFICRRGYVPLTLFHKLWKGSAVPTSAQDILAMAQTEISELQRLQSRMEAQLRDRRLREWKASLSEGTFGALGKWIKGKQMVCRKVTLVQQGVEAETHEQSARFIREHWESVWSEGRLANPVLSRQLASDFGCRPAGHWVGPSASDLHRALLHCKGSAGPDQWHSAEVKHLPFDAVQVWWTLTQRWLRSGSVPMQLTESRMVNLAKEGKVSGDGSLDPAATRPISVLSVFWPAFAAALLQTEDVQDWVSQSLDERVACRKAGLTTEALIARLQALYADQDGYIVSLDWSAAYDRLSPVICCQALTDCGWDPRFATLLQAVWANQVRWVQWGAHTSPTPLPSGRAVPQGCPIAPTILGFVATAGLRKVESNLGHDAVSVAVLPFTWMTELGGLKIGMKLVLASRNGLGGPTLSV